MFVELADRIDEHIAKWGIFDPAHELLREAAAALRANQRSTDMAKKAKKAAKAKAVTKAAPKKAKGRAR